MPKYTLKYFEFRCRAEPARILFFMNGVDFEDITVTDKEWTTLKNTAEYPTGTVPVLVVDNHIISQSKAIYSYLGREFGYYGKTNLEGAQIDCIMNITEELIVQSAPVYFYQGPGAFDKDRFLVERKDELKTYNEKTVPGLLKVLQTLLEMNKCDDGYFVGKEITVADLFFFTAIDYVEIFKRDACEGFPKLDALYEKIKAHPKVAEWLKKTDYMKHPYDSLKEKLRK